MSMSPIKRAFQDIMDERGLNMRSWALKAGLKETSVKAVMAGKSRHPRADTLAALAKAADVPVERLVAQASADGDVQISAKVDDKLLNQQLFDLISGLSLDFKLLLLVGLQEIVRLMKRSGG